MRALRVGDYIMPKPEFREMERICDINPNNIRVIVQLGVPSQPDLVYFRDDDNALRARRIDRYEYVTPRTDLPIDYFDKCNRSAEYIKESVGKNKNWGMF